MEIETITRYKFDGVEYDSIDKVKTEIENRIGKIIDYSDVTLTPKQKLNIHKAICEHKKELKKMLNVTFNREPNTLQGDWINILDFK